jgi:hypothetical protein
LSCISTTHLHFLCLVCYLHTRRSSSFTTFHPFELFSFEFSSQRHLG